MKKLLSLAVAVSMALSLIACSGSAGTASSIAPDAAQADPATITVTGLNGNSEQIEVEVPYDPQRVVVVDYANLDILDNLGLGGPGCRGTQHLSGSPQVLWGEGRCGPGGYGQDPRPGSHYGL